VRAEDWPRIKQCRKIPGIVRKQEHIHGYEIETFCCINLTACSDLGLRLHLKGLGVLCGKKYELRIDKAPNTTHLNTESLNWITGSIVFPHSSVCFDMSRVASMVTMSSHIDDSISCEPGQCLVIVANKC